MLTPEWPVADGDAARRATPRRRALLAMAALAFGLIPWTGCASSPDSTSGKSSWSLPWSKSASPASPTYDGLAQQQQQRHINSPAMGLDGSPEPGRMQKVAAAMSPAAIGRSISSGVKSGTDKVASAMRPRRTTDDSDDESSSSWFKKKEELSPDFYVSLAAIQEHSGNAETAGDHYRKALQIDPKHGGALLGYARLLDRQGQFGTATDYYKRAIKAHPNDATAVNDLGLCYARQGQYDKSLEWLGKAVEMRPERDLYRNNIATVLVEVGRVDAAVTHMAAIYGEPVAHYNVGLLLQQRGQSQAAIQQFAIAVEKQPNFDEAHQWLAQLSASEPPPQVAVRPTSAVGAAPGPAVSARPAAAAPSAQRTPQYVAAAPHATTTAPAASPVQWTREPEYSTGPAGPGVPPSPDDVHRQPVGQFDPATIRTPAPGAMPPMQSGYVPPSRY